jgi:hypothetical protein
MAMTKLFCGECGKPLVKGEGLITKGFGLRCYCCEVARSVMNAEQDARAARTLAWHWYRGERHGGNGWWRGPPYVSPSRAPRGES